LKFVIVELLQAQTRWPMKNGEWKMENEKCSLSAFTSSPFHPFSFFLYLCGTFSRRKVNNRRQPTDNTHIKGLMDLSTKTSDAVLLTQMLAGDEGAFVCLYTRYQSKIYRFALQMSGSAALAEDVTQEVFLTLMREGENYDSERGAVSAYLYGVARNFVLRKLSKESRFVAIDEDAGENGICANENAASLNDPLHDLTRKEMLEALRQAILALPAHYREVVVFCDLHEMSYAEVAEVLDCAIGTVRSRLSRARTLLMERVRKSEEPEKQKKVISAERMFV
jgi:RNA polymerase sigma-70 factor, ECF subfamily